jgi:hypothetical protein
MRICTNLLAVVSVTFLLVNLAGAASKTLRLVDGSGSSAITGYQGEPFSVEIRVDDAANIAGASFTVTYDAAKLALAANNPVTSVFFATFVKQGLITSPPEPAYVTVPGDSKEYYSPIVVNPVSDLPNPVTTGVRLAAARADNGTGADAQLFVLHFKPAVTPGIYPISIVQSTISNMAAGYCQAGASCPEPLPMLVGIDSATGTYPVHTVMTPVEATITVLSAEDADRDLIYDSWERAHVPAATPAEAALRVFTAGGDYDHDGYSDIQEFLNRNELDPGSRAYDPTVPNVPGGTGYMPPTGQPEKMNPAINLLLLRNRS